MNKTNTLHSVIVGILLSLVVGTLGTPMLIFAQVEAQQPCNPGEDPGACQNRQQREQAAIDNRRVDAEAAKKDAAIALAKKCEVWNGSVFSNFAECAITPLAIWIASFFLSFGRTAIIAAGWFFDLFILHAVVDFKGALEALGFMSIIKNVWTVIRDISNLLIIGMFTFIAISIILGIKEYGEKRLIARVLIIAALINFSLLFTGAIIDISNFVSLQFYSASAKTCVKGTEVFDIAQCFLKPMKITSVDDTQTALTSFTSTIKDDWGRRAGATFSFAILGMLLLLGVAFVLGYGCILILSRAVTLVFLMFTAAGAFATHILPKFSDGEFGWSAWWKALLDAAFFGPLMMIFLWASLLVMNSANGAVGNTDNTLGRSIGAITGDGKAATPDSTLWTVLMLYFMGIGLLFISFKVASKMAGAGAGAVSAVGNLAGTALTGVGGFAAGKLTNAYGINREKYHTGNARTSLDKAAGVRQKISALDSRHPEYEKNKKELEAEELKHKKAAEKSIGKAVSAGNLASMKFGGRKSMKEIEAERAKAAAAIGSKITSHDVENETKKKLIDEVTKNREGGHKEAKDKRDDAEEKRGEANDGVTQVNKAIGQERKRLTDESKTADDEEAAAVADNAQKNKDHEDELAKIDRELQAAEREFRANERPGVAGDNSKIIEVTTRRAAFLQTRESALQAETARIASARTAAIEKRTALNDLDTKLVDIVIKKDGVDTTIKTSLNAENQKLDTATKEFVTATKELNEYESQTAKELVTATEKGKEKVKSLQAVTADVTAKIGVNANRGWLSKRLGVTLQSDKRVGEQAKKLYLSGTKEDKRALEAIKKSLKDDDHATPAPAPTPPATPHT